MVTIEHTPYVIHTKQYPLYYAKCFEHPAAKNDQIHIRGTRKETNTLRKEKRGKLD